MFRRQAQKRSPALLLLLDVQRVSAQPRGILFDLQFLPTAFAAEGVIQVAGLLAGEVHNLEFSLTFGHGLNSLSNSGGGACWVFEGPQTPRNLTSNGLDGS